MVVGTFPSTLTPQPSSFVDFKSWLQAALDTHGIGAEDASGAAGMHRKTCGRLLKSQQIPAWKTISALARYFDVDTGELWRLCHGAEPSNPTFAAVEAKRMGHGLTYQQVHEG